MITPKPTTGAIPKIKTINTNNNNKVCTLNIADKFTSASLKNALIKKVPTTLTTTSTTVSSSTTSSVSCSTGSRSSMAYNMCNTMVETNNGSLNRISKSSLQWLLVNKWLPLWIGQGTTDCKVIDFNFMFSRNCMDCSHDVSQRAAVRVPDAFNNSAETITSNVATSSLPNTCSNGIPVPLGVPLINNTYGTSNYNGSNGGGLPHDIVHFNARAEMCCPTTASHMFRRQHIDLNNRPLHNALNRLRETEIYANQRRFDESPYENVHVQWQNGFEFGRSREHERSLAGPRHSLTNSNRSPLQRARSESPSSTQKTPSTVHETTANSVHSKNYRCLRSNNIPDNVSGNTGSNITTNVPFLNKPHHFYGVNYELNSENNTFKPKSNNRNDNNAFSTIETGTVATNLYTVEKNAIIAIPSLSNELEEEEGAIGGRSLSLIDLSLNMEEMNGVQSNDDTAIVLADFHLAEENTTPSSSIESSNSKNKTKEENSEQKEMM